MVKNIKECLQTRKEIDMVFIRWLMGEYIWGFGWIISRMGRGSIRLKILSRNLGYGIWENERSGLRLRSFWEKGHMRGMGVLRKKDGEEYKGMFADSKRNRYGIHTLADG